MEGGFEGKKIHWEGVVDALNFLHRSVDFLYRRNPLNPLALRFSLFVCVFSFPCIGASVIAFFLSTYLSRSLRFAYFLIFREKWGIIGSKETSSFLPLILRLFILSPILSLSVFSSSSSFRSNYHDEMFFLSVFLPLFFLNIIIHKMRSVRAMVFQKPGFLFLQPPLIFVSKLLTKKSSSSKWDEFFRLEYILIITYLLCLWLDRM